MVQAVKTIFSLAKCHGMGIFAGVGRPSVTVFQAVKAIFSLASVMTMGILGFFSPLCVMYYCASVCSQRVSFTDFSAKVVREFTR